MRTPDHPLLVALEWIEAHAVIPDGIRKGEAFRLSDEQLQFLANHYDVKENAKPTQLGTAFVFRRSQLVRPQKWGKSPLTAAQVCLEGMGPALFAGWADGGELYRCRDHGCGCGWQYEYEPGEPIGRRWPTPLIQVTATSEEQTANVYDALRPMILEGPLADVAVRVGEDFVRLPNDGRVDTVTSSARSRLGQRVTFVPQDETGLWTAASGMVKVAETQRRGLAGMGGRAVETTNAWDPSEDSVAQRTAESGAVDVYRDHRLAPATLSYRNKVERRRVHRIVYGESAGKGGWVDLNAIEAEAAELLERDPAQAERFFGNRVVYGLGTWLRDGVWDETELDVAVPPGTAVALGFDGSESDDWTAIRLETLEGGYSFTPTYGPDRRPTYWNPAEWGGSIPRAEVAAAVDELAGRYRIVLAYCDPRDWQSEIGDWSLRYGDKVFLEWATYRVAAMHAALERAVVDLGSGRLTHDRCPATATAVANARKQARPAGRYILGKPANHQKIDLAMATVLAHEAASVARESGLGAPEPEAYVYSA